MRMNDGISVRLTSRAIRTPKPRPTPMDRSRVKLLIVIAPKAIMTVVALASQRRVRGGRQIPSNVCLRGSSIAGFQLRDDIPHSHYILQDRVGVRQAE